MYASSNMRKSSNGKQTSWVSQDMKSPDIKSQQLFNALKDIYDRGAIIENIKKLPTVKERLDFIDMLLHRREEITDIEEMAQIHKYGPLFERVKQRFMRKINEKKAMNDFNKNRSSLFRRNSVLSPFNPTVVASESKNTDNKNNNALVKSSTMANTNIATNKKRGTMVTVLRGFTERKGAPNEQAKANDFDEVISTDELKKRRNTYHLVNPKYSYALEKELFYFAVKEQEKCPVLQANLANRQFQTIDNRVKNLLSDFKESNIKDHKAYIKSLDRFSSIPKDQNLGTINTARATMQTPTDQTNVKKKDWRENIIDESFVSFTETKLDQLYKKSQQLKRQIKKLDELCYYQEDMHIQETRDKKLRELEMTSKEIKFTINRKFQKIY